MTPLNRRGFSPAPTADELAPREKGDNRKYDAVWRRHGGGRFLGHKIEEFKRHHGNNQDLGTMAGLLGTAGAGAGALGAKLSGFFGKERQCPS
jgi:hypothetical protein